MRPHQCVKPLPQPVLRERLGDIRVRRHGKRVDPGIRAARAMNGRQLAGHAMDGFLERLLDGRPMVLPLPAHERPAVEFDGQPPAGH